jgi:urease accessory protein
MRLFTRYAAGAGDPIAATLTLAFDRRQKSRQRVTLDNGEAAGLQLPRGAVLRDGQRLQSDDGVTVQVRAADEPVSTVHSADPAALARAAYHLGNRHVALQVGDGWLRYRADHVLDDMVRGHGLAVVNEQAPFEPEEGAYAHAHHHETD